MNLQAEIFAGSDPAELQSAVNAWLEREKITEIDIVDLAQSIGSGGKIVLTILRKVYLKSALRQ